MADKLGVAEYDLEVNMREYFRDMKRAESETTKRTGAMAKGFATITKSAGAFAKGAAVTVAATAAVGAGFLVLVRRALNAAEGIADMAKRANTTTESLQELRFAVTQNGGSVRDADDALVRLNRRMSLFVSTGAGPGKLAFERLGISVQDANGNIRDSSDVFDEIAGKLADMKDSSEQAALASSAFGEDAGPRLVPLLKQGEDGIRAAREEARRLGIVLQDDAVQAAAEASAKFRALGETISAQFTSALIAAAPAITTLVEGMSNSLPTIIAWIQALGQVVGLLDAPLEVKLSENLAELSDVQKDIARVQGESNARNPSKKARLDQLLERRRQITLQQFEIQDSLEERKRRRASNSVTAPKMPPAPKFGSSGGGGAAKTLDDDAKAADRAARSFAQLTDRLGDLRLSTRQQLELSRLSGVERDRATTRIAREAREVEILEQAVRAGNKVTDEQVDLAMRAAREIETLTNTKNDDVRAERERTEAQRAAARETEIMRRETETLSRAIFQAVQTSDHWTETLWRVGEQILQLESTQNLLASTINSAFGVASETGTSGSSGLIGTLASGLGSFIGGFFADGGSPPVGKFSVVGENGPELRYFGQSSSIISNADSMDMLGGRNVHAPMSTTIHGVSEQEIMSKMEIRLKRHRDSIFNDMAQMSQENPDFA